MRIRVFDLFEYLWESIPDLFKNQWESPRINENHWESGFRLIWVSTENQFQNYLRIIENQWESPRINENHQRIGKNHQESGFRTYSRINENQFQTYLRIMEDWRESLTNHGELVRITENEGLDLFKNQFQNYLRIIENQWEWMRIMENQSESGFRLSWESMRIVKGCCYVGFIKSLFLSMFNIHVIRCASLGTLLTSINTMEIEYIYTCCMTPMIIANRRKCEWRS